MAEGALAVAEGADGLSGLVREAFIDPIRSVLIIDDQYPTWEQIFTAGFTTPKPAHWKEGEEILGVINQFRKKSKALTIDIHDGASDDGDDIANYLHQSDLLVLDYELEQSGVIGGRAIGIIKKLFANNHFNLIVLHTATTDKTVPFNAILTSLLRPSPASDEVCKMGFELVQTYEEDEPEAVASIKRSIGTSTYYSYRQHRQGGKTEVGFVQASPEMEAFRIICEKAGWNPAERGRVFCWAIQDHEKKLVDDPIRPVEVRWSAPREGHRGWIRTSGGFIAIADKNEPGLLRVLEEAIEDWKPSPSRLISSKIRASISAQGALAEETALSDKHVYWQYYNELCKASEGAVASSPRKSLIEAHAARHTERLFDLVGGDAIEFGLRLLASDPKLKDPSKDGYASHYNLSVNSLEKKQKALYHYNSHISTKQVSGWHLHPGHVFEACDELWVCVSPACDLVPEQKGQAAISHSLKAAVKPFMAVQLFKRSKPVQSKEITSNTLIFLKESAGDQVTAYSVFSDGGEGSSPVWRLFTAAQYGKFDIDSVTGTAPLKLSYLCGLSEGLKIENCDGKIVAQLRYEYALNLIQKLGVEMTRVGLDFITHD